MIFFIFLVSCSIANSAFASPDSFDRDSVDSGPLTDLNTRSALDTSARLYDLLRRGLEVHSSEPSQAGPGRSKSNGPTLPRYPSPEREGKSFKARVDGRGRPRVSVQVKGPGDLMVRKGRRGARERQSVPAQASRRVGAEHNVHVTGFGKLRNNRAAVNEEESQRPVPNPLEAHGQGRTVTMTVKAPRRAAGLVRTQSRGGEVQERIIPAGTEDTIVKSSNLARGAHVYGSVPRPGRIEVTAEDLPGHMRYGSSDSSSSSGSERD